MKRKTSLSERKLARTLQQRAQWGVLPIACLATLLGLPVNAAVTIPGDPLASGVRVAPNITFILDNSGSMEWENINNGDIAAITGVGGFNDGPSSTGVGNGNVEDLTDDTTSTRVGSGGSPSTVNQGVMYEQNYITNTLYYNPSVDYKPWYDATGNRLTGGTQYDDVYSDISLVDYVGTDSTTASAQLNLGTADRTFYAPKAAGYTNAQLSDVSNYYRFRILAGGARIMRGEYGTIAVTNNSPSIGTSSGTLSSNPAVDTTTASVSEGRSLEITIDNSTSSGSNRNLNYWVFNQSMTQVCSGMATQGGTDPKCTVYPTESGSYTIRVQRTSNNNTSYALSARISTSCDNSFSNGSRGWVNCSEDTPEIPNPNYVSGGPFPLVIQRSLDDEKVNFATWYSYYRNRIKAAKGGAAEAFNNQGNKVRVGYRALTKWISGSSGIINDLDIEVTDGNDGRFVNNDGTNGNPTTRTRSRWYNRLFRAQFNDVGTPLQSALNSAGTYYEGSANSGPYGPEAGANQLSCRQNFTVLTTDGYWNNGRVSIGSDGDDDNGATITNGPLAADGGVLPTDTQRYKSFRYTPRNPYMGGTNTLADVAMKYWKRDLRTDLANNVPSDYSSTAADNYKTDRDPAFWQHMVTFTISIGLKTTRGWSSIADVTIPPSSWPATSDNNAGNLDDLLHAAVNGRGAFVSASNPQAFADGLEAALAKISERTASFSNVGATSSTELTANAKIFSASYVSGRWTGLLRAESAISPYGELWKTTNTGTFASHGSRNIITRGGTLTGGVGGTGTGGGASFPTAQQTTALERTGGPANYAVTGADNAAYIRGDQSKEGTAPGKLRTRTTLLGDIVDSSPAYVTDTNTVYIGANDGMLHAFDAANGRELFAYIPGIINFGNLADLSRRDYDHRWFVDGPIAISPRELSPDGTKNILVGTLGRGGKGVYALDVTNPSTFGSANVKWERNASPSNHMGMVLGAPILAKVRNGTPSPAVVLGNGINSGSDTAALIVLNMDDGSVIREIPTDGTTNNGLFAPTGVYGADGVTLVYVYAGDLQGNVWKFDLTSTTPGAWSAKKIFAAGPTQPITGGIATALDPRTGKTWILFGTGSFLTAADANDMTANKNSMYGVIDDITTGSAYTRSNLTVRTVTADGAGERYFQDLTNLTNKGWYVDLPDKGERIVQNAQIDGSYLVTASMMPSGNSCSDASGSGYINAITPFPDMTSMNGRSYFDLDGDGNTDDTGTSGKPTGSFKTNGIPTLPLLLPGQGRYGTADGVGRYNKGRPAWNRVSWRELRKD